MKKQYGIRLIGEAAATVENFAEVHKMSKTAAAEFFVKLGIESMTKDERLEARLNAMEEHLKLVYRSLARSSIYLSLMQPGDAEKAKKAEEQAALATAKIFGE